MLTLDKLWKAIFEDFFQEAFLFYFPAFYPFVDWSRGFEFLDKERKQIFPDSEESHRRVDILVKVWLLDGTEQWILVHIEVQGYRDEDFARRMFVYFYRLTDRFQKPITTLALLTDTDEKWKPDRYVAHFMNTKLTYEYPVFKLADYSETDFDNSENPWAWVMKTALIGLKSNWDDASLLQMKIKLYREFREKGFSVEKTRLFLQFLKHYVRFDGKEFFDNFDHEIQIIDHQKESTMGIIELVKEHMIQEAREEGLEEGRKEGREEGRIEGMTKGELLKAKKITLLIMEKYPEWKDEDIAAIVDMPVAFVEQVRKEGQEEGLAS